MIYVKCKQILTTLMFPTNRSTDLVCNCRWLLPPSPNIDTSIFQSSNWILIYFYFQFILYETVHKFLDKTILWWDYFYWINPCIFSLLKWTLAIKVNNKRNILIIWGYLIVRHSHTRRSCRKTVLTKN